MNIQDLYAYALLKIGENTKGDWYKMRYRLYGGMGRWVDIMSEAPER